MKVAACLCAQVFLGVYAWGVSYPLTLVDGRGDATRLNAKPERVVSIAPSATDIVVELQGWDRLVGVSEHCQLSEEAGTVARLPIYPGPSAEKLLGLQPDLVLAADITSPQVVAQLRRLGLCVLVLNSAGLEGVVADIRLVGEALDLTESAQRIVARFQSIRKRVRTALRTLDDRQKPTVLMALSPALDYFVGRGVYADALITEAGGRNLGASVGLQWPKLSAESLIDLNPDVIFISQEEVSAAARRQLLVNLRADPNWQEMRAVKRGSVYLIESQLFSVPGTRLQWALPILFEYLHPELAPL